MTATGTGICGSLKDPVSNKFLNESLKENQLSCLSLCMLTAHVYTTWIPEVRNAVHFCGIPCLTRYLYCQCASLLAGGGGAVSLVTELCHL